jgi:transcriptional regulator with XRE-family HTH domain
MSEAQTFGEAISEARKRLGWSQKELASKILREDEDAISPQYLNDIEHNRRSPSSDHMVQQFADVLKINADWLYYLAGKFPADVRQKKMSQQEVSQAMFAFRRDPKRK